MHNPSGTQQHLNSTRLRAGCLAVGIVWLLALWSFGGAAYFGDGIKGRTDLTARVDLPLHANGEYSLSLKRFFNRYKDQPKAAEPPEPIWALTSTEENAALDIVAANQQSPVINTPVFCLQQFQTLNIPRAPPVV